VAFVTVESSKKAKASGLSGAALRAVVAAPTALCSGRLKFLRESLCIMIDTGAAFRHDSNQIRLHFKRDEDVSSLICCGAHPRFA
jgi:hypothetical protein